MMDGNLFNGWLHKRVEHDSVRLLFTFNDDGFRRFVNSALHQADNRQPDDDCSHGCVKTNEPLG